MLCNRMHAYISFMVSTCQNREGPRIITNRDWSTPNARSTSFIAPSYLLANNYLFDPCGIEIVLKNVVRAGRYHLLDNISYHTIFVHTVLHVRSFSVRNIDKQIRFV